MTFEDSSSWTVFGVEISGAALGAIRRDAEGRYPREACGLVFGAHRSEAADCVRPLENVAEREGAFAFDPGEHGAVLEEEDERGRVERVHYHSHADAGAYLSAEDRAALAPGGQPVMPGMVHVVVEVRGGVAGEVAAFRWNPDRRSFDEAHPPVPKLPDLELRAGRSDQPIRPVGGRLAGRRLGPVEADQMRLIAEGRAVHLPVGAEAFVLRFELGLLSPLTGFQRPEEARAVEALGRTPQGVPWRTPVTLELPQGGDWPTGQVVELLGVDGRPLALMVMAQAASGHRAQTVGGPLYVYPSGRSEARDIRAVLLAAGAKRVLAVPDALSGAGVALMPDFDAVLADDADRFGARLPIAPLYELDGRPWLTAAIAQNAGATHIVVSDRALAHDIRHSLEIEPVLWPPEDR